MSLTYDLTDLHYVNNIFFLRIKSVTMFSWLTVHDFQTIIKWQFVACLWCVYMIIIEGLVIILI